MKRLSIKTATVDMRGTAETSDDADLALKLARNLDNLLLYWEREAPDPEDIEAAALISEQLWCVLKRVGRDLNVLHAVLEAHDVEEAA